VTLIKHAHGFYPGQSVSDFPLVDSVQSDNKGYFTIPLSSGTNLTETYLAAIGIAVIHKSVNGTSMSISETDAFLERPLRYKQNIIVVPQNFHPSAKKYNNFLSEIRSKK
jgi:hypothetical protein